MPWQQGSDWGVGPPQPAIVAGAGRQRGAPHDPTADAENGEGVFGPPPDSAPTPWV